MNTVCSLLLGSAIVFRAAFSQEEECSAINPVACMADVKGDVFLDFLERNPSPPSFLELPNGGLVVPLRKMKVSRNDTKLDHDVFFYIGNVSIGYPPQKMSVLFDTASGNVIMPHRRCSSPACVTHKRYSSWTSTTAEDVFPNGTRIRRNERLIKGRTMRERVSMSYTAADLGDGFVKGPYVKDRVCVADGKGDKVCATPVMVAALEEDELPFKYMPNDGIVGLSLGGLSVKSPFNFFASLIESRPQLKQQFAMTFSSDGGELHVGGYDQSRLAAPLQWFPVHEPDVGYWQVPILAVRVGGKVVDACTDGCHAVLDTGSSRLGVQKSHLPAVRAALSRGLVSGETCTGPDMVFELGGMSVVLTPKDYAGDDCEPELGSLDLDEPDYHGVYTFGEMVLRHYFVVFDWKDKRLGFAPAKAPRMVQTFV